MSPRPDAGRSYIDLARVSFGIGDEFGKGLGRNRWIEHHDVGNAIDGSDRRDVAEKNEIELVVKRRVDLGGRVDQQERITVRGRADDRVGADITAAARA